MDRKRKEAPSPKSKGKGLEQVVAQLVKESVLDKNDIFMNQSWNAIDSLKVISVESLMQTDSAEKVAVDKVQESYPTVSIKKRTPRKRSPKSKWSKSFDNAAKSQDIVEVEKKSSSVISRDLSRKPPSSSANLGSNLKAL
jgi:hypothetical protein